jgi:very-short-patch-repair endonuclease
MFNKTEIVPSVDVMGRKVKIKISYFVCDHCKNDYSLKSCKTKYINKQLHFCGKSCSTLAYKKGGVIDNMKRSNCLKKYGAEHHFKSQDIQNKRINTCIKKFGGKAPMSSDIIKEKTQKTIFEKYGEHYSLTDEVQSKKRKTCLEKYGVDSYSKTNEFKSSLDWLDINKKGFETRKKLGISPVSKIEKRFESFLRENFGEVVCQVPISTWWIDFYLPSKNVYVQFDGDYWHGLNKSQEELLSSPKPRDKVIAETQIRDEKKENWFKEQNLVLIRIAESQFKKKEYQKILGKIEGRNGL